MRSRHIIPRLVLSLSLFLAAGVVLSLPETQTPPPVAATPFVNGPVTLTSAQAAVFKDALAALAQQGHVCIVAEGSPLHSTLAPDKVPVVPDHTPLEDAVRMVADAYDYDAQRTGNVFTLTKRYTDPADMPSVTLKECTTALEDVSLMLNAFDPPSPAVGPSVDPGWDTINSVLSTLSPDQFQKAQSKQGLPVSSLGPDQRAAVDRWDRGILLDGSCHFVDRLLSSLKRIPQSQVGMGSIAVNAYGHGTVAVFGLQGTDAAGKVSFNTFEGYVVFPGGKEADQSGGPVTADELNAARARRAQADGHETLEQAVAALDGRGGHFQVLDELAAKTVTVAGDANAAPAAVLDGLAAVYGLRVQARPNAPTLLTHPERVTPVDLTTMHDQILSALPAPLLRAAHFADAQALKARLNAPRPKINLAIFAQIKAQQDERDRLYKQYDEASHAPRREHAVAVRALRVATELYPASVKVGGLVPVSAMTPEDRGLVATAYMMTLLDQISTIVNPDGINYVNNVDQEVLVTGLSPNHDGRSAYKIHLALMRPMPNGDLFPAMGTSDVAYHGPLPASATPVPSGNGPPSGVPPTQ